MIVLNVFSGSSASQNGATREIHFFMYGLIFLFSYAFTCMLLKYHFEKGDQQPLSVYEYTKDTESYIVSTYYYPESKSQGDNALAMLFLMNRYTMPEISNHRMTLIASNATDSIKVVPRLLRKEIYTGCSYASIVSKSNLLPGLTKLEITDGSTRMEIPFRKPRESAPKPVIVCITPQFLSEQWQLFITQAHVVQRFGGHMHMYVTSMMSSYFQLVREYEKHGYVTVDNWIRPKFASSPEALEPNANSEWRNMAGAKTDCLLQYKEVAKFVTFMDLDDLLFPNGFDSYYDEFSFLSHAHPNIKVFVYPRREYLIYRKSQMDEIDFTKEFGHTYFVPKLLPGKVMARPENINSTWIHFTYNTPENQQLRLTSNFMYHLQKPRDRNVTEVDSMKIEYVEMKELKRDKKVLESVQKDYERMLNLTEIQSISEHLPRENFYLPIMFDCYHRSFYKYNHFEKKDVCSNAEDCEIPQRPDQRCMHSEADYVSGPRMSPFTFHYHVNPRFLFDVDCAP